MSLRDRFGRLWGRSSDNDFRPAAPRPATQLGHRRLDTETEDQQLTGTVTSLSPSFSPRKLHKAASTTFQAISDSLRFKAQAFYTSPSHAEADPSGSQEPTMPQRSGRRSALWSSVKSRGSRSSCRAKLVPQAEPVTPTKTGRSSNEPAPKLELEIPGHSLRDSIEDSDEVTTPPMSSSGAPIAMPEVSAERLAPVTTSTLRYEPKQLWPSPHMQLRQFPIANGVATVVATVSSNTHRQGPDPVAEGHDSHASVCSGPHEHLTTKSTESDSAAASFEKAEALRFSEDAGYASDVESNTGTFTTDASTAPTSISGPSSSIAIECNLSHSSTWNTSSSENSMLPPGGRVCPGSKRTLASIGILPPDQQYLRGEVDRADRAEASNITGSELSPPTEQLRGDKASKSPQKEPIPKVPCECSNTCDADVEDNCPPNASMGPRIVWDEARAKRNERYKALQSMSADVDASTDEDPEFGSELTTSPHLTCIPIPDDKAGQRSDDRTPRRSQKYFSLRRIRPRSNLKATKQHTTSNLSFFEDTGMSTPNATEGSTSASNSLRPTQYINIDEYMNDRELRLGLHESRAEVVLYEPSDMANASTSKDRILITSRLDPEDEFMAKLINAPYARGASLDRPEGSAKRLTIEIQGQHDSELCHQETGIEAKAEEILAKGVQETVVIGSSSDESSDDPGILSSDVARGRSSKRSSPGTAEKRSSHVPGKSSTHTQRDHTPTRRHASDSKAIANDHYTSQSSSSANRSAEEFGPEWLGTYAESLDGVLGAHGYERDGSTTEPRPRLSMVERRYELNRRTSYNRLSQIVYEKEKESEDEMEEEEDRAEVEAGAGAEATPEFQPEPEDGYAGAIFQGQ
ncbi:MAG: hypothetical protein Q9201_005052 [Fulgogasparrea decipioides]